LASASSTTERADGSSTDDVSKGRGARVLPDAADDCLLAMVASE